VTYYAWDSVVLQFIHSVYLQRIELSPWLLDLDVDGHACLVSDQVWRPRLGDGDELVNQPSG
jgi:hypothetical protein